VKKYLNCNLPGIIMKKRGVSQLDWIMSLAIFLLYVGWFFVFINPSISLASGKDSMIVTLKYNFNSDFTTEIRSFPLFIEYDGEQSYKPIIISYYSNQTDLRFMDGPEHIIWNNNLMFLSNISPGITEYWILSGGNYTRNYLFEGLNVEPGRVSTSNMSVWFSNSLPDTVMHNGMLRISSIVYSVNEVEFIPSENSYEDLGFAAVYQASTSGVNHTAMVFAHAPEIYNFITAASSYTYTLVYDLHAYNSYFSDNTKFGSFDYGVSESSHSHTHDYITIYTETEGLTLFFDTDVEFHFTAYNSTLRMEIEIPSGGNLDYKVIFHKGNHTSVARYPYSARFGVYQTIKGIGLEQITTDYDNLKEKWRYPAGREFSIRVFENTSAYSYMHEKPLIEIGLFDPNRRNVYSETEDVFGMDSNGTLRRLHVNYRIW
jgi:hypothetical protein